MDPLFLAESKGLRASVQLGGKVRADAGVFHQCSQMGDQGGFTILDQGQFGPSIVFEKDGLLARERLERTQKTFDGFVHVAIQPT